ncbi:hypothetical protein TVAG_225350 [Trichomonas vaginalis G3]|uniref:Uncharacterized protein n=1 Tax=Trichomonas vaginalis (strain ATCC PRA-98 / G3) TaxID=412133 RepID=A2DNR4_TRIV3|nr:hypothetical protein TVAGG3_0288490 [Trichomonas vaginalis G3]EAY17909.1 hypothetical protein TVAG_225350 [Trichomonas vaginalis G3]KAI5527072.1 hypothetical protein TVAGG3_0288490 [Trichomonas vaginalis G3]|eukprot:XP_001578895.1 hypothetical protein [Trichomonas vaginalis G3]
MIERVCAALDISIWCWCGYEVSSLFLIDTCDVVTRIAVGIPVGMYSYAWLIFVLNLKYEFSILLGLYSTLGYLVAAILIHLLRKQRKTPKGFPLKELALILGLPMLSMLIFMKFSFLYKGDITRGAVYGDFPFHMNIISSFVYGCNKNRRYLFDTVSPFFAGVKLAYPVLVNFLSSIMIGCFGCRMTEAILYPSIPVAFSMLLLFNQIVAIFTRERITCCLAPWLFLCLGGRGFFRIFKKEAVEDYGIDFVHNWGADRYAYWLQTVMHVLLPQRLSLFGLPLSYAFMVIIMRSKFTSVKSFILAGLIVALMPQIQAHALIAAFEWLLAWAVINFKWKQPKEWWPQIKCYIALGIPALTLGIPQLVPYMERSQEKGFFTINPVWNDDKLNFFILWYDGLYMFFLISIFAGFAVLTKRQIKIYIPALFVFFCSNIMHYQPWNMDNSKVFYAGWIPFACAVVAIYLMFLSDQEGFFFQLSSLLLLLACIFSGLLCILIHMLNSATQWNPYEDVYGFAKQVIDKTDPKGIWLADSFHDHPVATLAGRQLLVGYRGWLMSHHLDETEREDEMRKCVKNPNKTEWMDKHNVTYVAYHKQSHDEVDMDFNVSTKWDLIIDDPAWKVYHRNNVR